MTQIVTPVGKHLIFPVNRFDELFDDYRPWSQEDSFEPIQIHKQYVESMYIGSYCMLRGGNALRVKPNQKLVRGIEESMIAIEYERTHFEIIDHDDGRSLVVCSHGQIIGSRWLARIDSKTVPRVVEE